jgi:hypothetical protein
MINGEKKNAYRILLIELQGKGLLGRPRRRWVDNIKMDLREVGLGGMDCIDLAQDRDHRSCERGNKTSGSIKFGIFLRISAASQ